jgi:hypothetical protein
MRWLEGDEGEIERLLAQLHARRKRIPELIEAVRNARPSLFPAWS